MENNRFITIETLIERYHIDRSFIDALCEHGLLRVLEEETAPCIESEQLADMERMIRLHYELEINMAGIDAIFNLLRRLEEMQHEVNRLRNRLGE